MTKMQTKSVKNWKSDQIYKKVTKTPQKKVEAMTKIDKNNRKLRSWVFGKWELRGFKNINLNIGLKYVVVWYSIYWEKAYMVWHKLLLPKLKWLRDNNANPPAEVGMYDVGIKASALCLFKFYEIDSYPFVPINQ